MRATRVRLGPRYRWTLAACVVAAWIAAAPYLYVRFATLGDIVGPGDTPRHAEAAIILGAKVGPDGVPSPFLLERVLLGAQLYRDGSVDVLVLTGATGPDGYDEPGTMRLFARAAGVPDEAIILDREGWDTFASCSNAAGPLGIDTAIVVTQEFHVARATWLCQQAGIDAQGLYPPIGARAGTLTGNLREVGATWKAVLNVWGAR